MIYFIAWYLTISLLGLISFPLAYHLFPALADRGYSLSRALGLLFWGFGFWLLVSFGVIRNEVGGLLFILVLLLSLSIWALGSWEEFNRNLKWIKNNRSLVISIEVLFFVAFAACSFVRANNPEMTSAGGEKWMEVAFINAILHSPSFPPHDPWLSGYAISYYYFGYVLTSMLAMINGTTGSIAHNLMLSLVFSMSAIGAYGLLYNLLAAYWRKNDTAARVGAFFAPMMLLLMSNAEGFLELLHSYGIGWSASGANIWTWLNIKDLNEAPTLPYIWEPRYWFWWRASRVVHDYDLRGNFLEIIDEFPFFSYLLGDLHPHVLAMPFGLLALAIALNLYLGGWQGETNLFGLKIPVGKQGLAIMPVVLGGLAFLNTWDFPVYLAVMSGAFLLYLVNERGWNWNLLEEFLKFSIPVAISSVILYLPFYLSFSSQAGGILPNILFPTRGAHLWIMFGTLFVPLFLFLGWLIGKRTANWKIGFGLIIGLVLMLWVFSLALGVAAGQTDVGRSFITSQGLTSTRDVFLAAGLRRLEYGGGLLTLILLIGAALSFMTGQKSDYSETAKGRSSPIPFVLMFIVFGGLMVVAPEFVYLRDQFGWRMNTVFKFYYQAWTLWSVAAAFGFALLLRELGMGNGSGKNNLRLVLFSVVMGLVCMVGLTYPVLSIPNKTENFSAANPDRRTLDGAAYLGIYNPDDYAAVNWLALARPGIVAEAVSGGYSEFARVSTYSGMPAVLGWTNHESQWRGGSAEMGSRADDISRLYTTPEWVEALSIVDRYNIRYIFVGRLERTTYPVNEKKFTDNLSEVYRQGDVVIYEVP